MTRAVRKILDFALLQVGWFACVLGGAAGNGWIGPASVLAFVAAHVLWIAPREIRWIEVRNVVVLGVVGSFLDVLQVRAGVLCFAQSEWTVLGIPPWLAALWFLFPILFNTTFEWLHGRPWLTAFLALVGAPLSYRAGAALDALEIGANTWASLASLAIVWAVYLPGALCFATLRMPGVATRRSP